MEPQESDSLQSTFIALILIGFFARLSYGMARTPLLALFAKSLGASSAFIGLAVGMSTVTGIFFKAPSGTLSDLYGRRKILFAATLIFGLMPFTYYLVNDYKFLIVIRFFHGFATAIYGPVAMAVIMDIAGDKKGQLVGTYSSAGLIGGLIAAPFSGWLLNYLSSGIITDKLVQSIITTTLLVLIFISSLGGIAVVAGGFFVWKNHVSIGKLLISLGAGVGFFWVIFLVFVLDSTGDVFSQYNVIGWTGLILAFTARLLAVRTACRRYCWPRCAWWPSCWSSC